MERKDDDPPLFNDPAREAVASMRGYWAQVWRSVLAWMELSGNERLYLEGAEDFDRISGNTAETVQVKDLKGNISLRSGDVIEAIDNAWANQQRNLKRQIHFRFLTTAGISVEQSAPFGKGIGGLRLWSSTRLSNDVAERQRNARAIAEFLVSDGKVSAAVRAFLQTAPDATIWERFIEPIEWDTDAEEAPEVKREIQDRLVNLGQPLGVTPDRAEAVAVHLYEVAFTMATRQKDRFLTHADLVRVFCERTHQAIPAATYNAIQATIPKILAMHGAADFGSTAVAIGGKTVLIGRPPPLPARYYARATVLTDMGQRLSKYGVVVLQGGTGVGKSTVAAGYIALSTSVWGWVDLRGLRSADLRDRLGRTLEELSVESDISHIVLDDIEPPDDSRQLATHLARLKNIVAARNGHLVITSSVVFPQRLSLALALPSNGMMAIPAFSRDEIEAFLLARGCPSTGLAGELAPFIELHTSGHAQLVHARIATLEVQGFPTPEIHNLVATPFDVLEAKTEARRLIAMLDGPTREFVYRLSLTIGSLAQSQLIAIAVQPPAIVEPGLALDRLIGPWLEVVREGLYRVSPLLRNVGMDVQGEDWTRETHRSIVRALMACRTLTPNDVSAILFHGFAGRDWLALARLSYGILTSDSKLWEALASGAGWFVWIGTRNAVARPDTDSFSLFLIRLLQFRLALAAKDDDAAMSIIERINSELPANIPETRLRMARYFFLGQLLLYAEVKLPIAQRISISLEYIRLSDELVEVLPKVDELTTTRVLKGPDGTSDLAAVAGFLLTQHLTNRSSLVDLLDICQELPTAELRRLLWFVGERYSTAGLVFDGVWVAEMGASAPDWIACRDVFRRAYEFGRHHGLRGWARAAARAISRITDENMKDSAGALKLAEAMAVDIGWSPIQEDGLATILLRAGESQRALAIWRRILPGWAPTDEFDLQQAYSHREAAVAAARLGKWNESAEWLRTARELADDINQPTYCAGLLVDEGYARWKGGDDHSALHCLVEGLIAIDRLASDDADPGAFLLRKRAGHVIMWIAHTASGITLGDLFEAPAAWCSSLEPMKEVNTPSTPSDSMWAHIIEFEFAAELGADQFSVYEDRLKMSRFGLVRLPFNQLRLQHRLRHLNLTDFVEVVVDWVESFELCRTYYMQGGLSAADPLPAEVTTVDKRQLNADLILNGMLNAVIVSAARGVVMEHLLATWAVSSNRVGLSATIDPWLQFVEALFVKNTIDPVKTVRERSLSGPWRAVASIRIAIDSAVAPEELLAIHAYWIDALPNETVRLLPLPDIERLISSAWLRLCGRSFLLRAPAVTVPVLQQACASSATGWQKIAEVLIAACDAVSSNVPAEIRQRFRTLKKNGHP